MYVASETPVVQIGEDDPAGETGASGSASARAFNFPGEAASSVTGIIWRPALQAALLLAVPAGVLCSGFSTVGQNLGLVWMVGAAVWAVALYARRARTGWLSTGSGARIGLITGMLASWLTLALNGIWLWIERFPLRQGPQIDADWLVFVDRVLDVDHNMYTQMGISTAELTQQMQLQRGLLLSSEGHAGFQLFGFVAGTTFLVLFSAIGGAIGARVLAQPRRPKAY
jgi:hypothetical protein